MSAFRKLKFEMDNILKKIDEGVLNFEDLLERLSVATTKGLKEKYEIDLKREVKRLQRMRDQLKVWLLSPEVREKDVLNEKKRLIEKQMERFHDVERETKIKQYSREGLAASKVSMTQRIKEETAAWLSTYITELQAKIDAFETEIEKNLSPSKKLLPADKKERNDSLRQAIERHRYHIKKLETLLRLLDNNHVSPDEINDLKDDVKYFIDYAEEPGFEENMFLYDELTNNVEDEEDDMTTPKVDTKCLKKVNDDLIRSKPLASDKKLPATEFIAGERKPLSIAALFDMKTLTAANIIDFTKESLQPREQPLKLSQAAAKALTLAGEIKNNTYAAAVSYGAAVFDAGSSTKLTTTSLANAANNELAKDECFVENWVKQTTMPENQHRSTLLVPEKEKRPLLKSSLLDAYFLPKPLPQECAEQKSISPPPGFTKLDSQLTYSNIASPTSTAKRSINPPPGFAKLPDLLQETEQPCDHSLKLSDQMMSPQSTNICHLRGNADCQKTTMTADYSRTLADLASKSTTTPESIIEDLSTGNIFVVKSSSSPALPSKTKMPITSSNCRNVDLESFAASVVHVRGAGDHVKQNENKSARKVDNRNQHQSARPQKVNMTSAQSKAEQQLEFDLSMAQQSKVQDQLSPTSTFDSTISTQIPTSAQLLVQQHLQRLLEENQAPQQSPKQSIRVQPAKQSEVEMEMEQSPRETLSQQYQLQQQQEMLQKLEQMKKQKQLEEYEQQKHLKYIVKKLLLEKIEKQQLLQQIEREQLENLEKQQKLKQIERQLKFQEEVAFFQQQPQLQSKQRQLQTSQSEQSQLQEELSKRNQQSKKFYPSSCPAYNWTLTQNNINSIELGSMPVARPLSSRFINREYASKSTTNGCFNGANIKNQSNRHDLPTKLGLSGQQTSRQPATTFPFECFQNSTEPQQEQEKRQQQISDFLAPSATLSSKNPTFNKNSWPSQLPLQPEDQQDSQYFSNLSLTEPENLCFPSIFCKSGSKNIWSSEMPQQQQPQTQYQESQQSLQPQKSKPSEQSDQPRNYLQLLDRLFAGKKLNNTSFFTEGTIWLPPSDQPWPSTSAQQTYNEYKLFPPKENKS